MQKCKPAVERRQNYCCPYHCISVPVKRPDMQLTCKQLNSNSLPTPVIRIFNVVRACVVFSICTVLLFSPFYHHFPTHTRKRVCARNWRQATCLFSLNQSWLLSLRRMVASPLARRYLVFVNPYLVFIFTFYFNKLFNGQLRLFQSYWSNLWRGGWGFVRFLSICNWEQP